MVLSFPINTYWICALSAWLLVGCGHQRGKPYPFGSSSQYFTSARLKAITEDQIEWGQPRPLLDGLGWVLGIPAKITLWDIRIDNHDISPETEEAVAEYLAANDLDSVKVRLNQYDPLDEWRRLKANDSVGAGWRYTFGAVYWLGDTIFPGRIWGGDRYNPYTNTINIYSDAPSIAIHEGGHAKDWARRKYKGTYAAVYVLPIAPLWHEAIASRDALAFIDATGTPEDQEEAYRLLYPAYGTYVGNAAGDFIPGPIGIPYVGSVLVGHIWGRLDGHRAAAAKRAEEETQQTRDVERLPAPPEE